MAISTRVGKATIARDLDLSRIRESTRLKRVGQSSAVVLNRIVTLLDSVSRCDFILLPASVALMALTRQRTRQKEHDRSGKWISFAFLSRFTPASEHINLDH